MEIGERLEKWKERMARGMTNMNEVAAVNYWGKWIL